MISSIKEDSINLIQTQYQSNCYMWTAFYVYVITVTIILYDIKLVRMGDKVTGFWVKRINFSRRQNEYIATTNK